MAPAHAVCRPVGDADPSGGTVESPVGPPEHLTRCWTPVYEHQPSSDGNGSSASQHAWRQQGLGAQFSSESCLDVFQEGTRAFHT